MRRNAISVTDARVVYALAAAAGVAAAFAGCHPTGEAVPDVIVTAAFAGFVTWASASAPYWALAGAAGIAAVFAANQPALVAIALIALGLGLFLGLNRGSLPALRALSGALTVQVVLRLTWNPMFLGSAMVALAAVGLLVVTGVSRRQRYIRRRTLIGAAGVAGFVVLAVLGLALGGALASSSANDGYKDLLSGLRAVRSGDPTTAAASLRKAATELHDASDQWTAPWAQPARMVPVLAQNSNALGDIMRSAGDSADAAAKALDLVDLSQLRVINGVIDVEALGLLSTPLGDLAQSVGNLAEALDTTNSPWLLDPVQSRIASANDLAGDVKREAQTTQATAQVGPAMLGLDGPRRYFIAFTSPAEARGLTGLMGNWAEVTINKGALKLTDHGRTAELINGLTALTPPSGASAATLKATDEFFARYGPYGAGTGAQGSTVTPKFWSNITMSPDMPTVGSSMAQLYEQATGRAVDGAIVIDPKGLAAMLEVTGPVSVAEANVTLSAETVEKYLLLDQYNTPEGKRADVLEAVTLATVDRILHASLPGPQVLAADMGPAATQGHISVWATRPDEQRLMQLTGMDAALPNSNGLDLLAVVNDNASGNKIDTFLERSVTYKPVFNERTGRTDAELTITLTNNAPTSGYPDYVIANLVDLPTGTNRTLLSVFTPLAFTAATLDDEPIGLSSGTEQGSNVFSTYLNLAPGQQRTVHITLQGALDPGPYQLMYRPQPLAQPEDLFVEAKNPSGRTLAGFAGNPRRRSVLSGKGLSPWR